MSALTSPALNLIPLSDIEAQIDELALKRAPLAVATRDLLKAALTVRTGADKMDGAVSRWLILSAIAFDGDILTDDKANRAYVESGIAFATGLTAKSAGSVKTQSSWVRTLARKIVKSAAIPGSIDSPAALAQLLATIDAGVSLSSLYKDHLAERAALKSDDKGDDKCDDKGDDAKASADPDKMTLSLTNVSAALVEWLKSDDSNVLSNEAVARIALVRTALNHAAEVHNSHREALANV